MTHPISGGPVTVAQARAAGLSRRHIDGPLWAAPTRGVRISRELLEADECQRIYAVARALPADAAISGWAAAYVMGVRWYDSARRILVIRALDMARVRRPGVTTRRSNLDEGDAVILDGIRMTSPLRTAFELLRTPPLPDAVTAVDAMLHHRLVSLEDLVSYVERRPRWRGVRLARRALPLLDAAAESPMESRLRLIWVLGGLPRPLVNVALYDTRTGASLGRPDLLDVEAGVVVEYDGAHHRDPVQHRADNAREHRLEEAGLIVIRFDGHDTLVTQARTLEVMRSAHRRGLQRDRRHDRWSTTWTPWWE